MADKPQTEEAARGGVRQGDRRQDDRRRSDRRAPVPLWRRPWAYAAYGVIGALLVVLLLSGDEEPQTGGLVPVEVPPAVDTMRTPAASAPPQDARTVGDYERLLAQGQAAVGQRVRTLLFCEAVSPISVVRRENIRVTPSVAALTDASGRVPGAQCRWGDPSGSAEFLLLVPPALAERFAASPEVTEGFVSRRRVEAEVEWIGRSEPLALRNVGVLRGIR